MKGRVSKRDGYQIGPEGRGNEGTVSVKTKSNSFQHNIPSTLPIGTNGKENAARYISRLPSSGKEGEHEREFPPSQFINGEGIQRGEC